MTTSSNQSRPALITGGAGFIGTNLADRLASQGRPVLVYDNLSRPGVERNWEWLQRRHPRLVTLIRGDVRDGQLLRAALREASSVFHFAAQVAVTTSVTDPRTDFEVNALGTLNLVDGLRSLGSALPVVYTSTNKVYGSLADVGLHHRGARYEPADRILRHSGISEERALEFHTPYGCSKGAADQYVLDYARTYGGRSVVFRMSCIYGPHQHGTEDQGWVAHFALRALDGQPITLYGDGCQVRDVLFVEDLVEAFLLAESNASRLAGQAFNMGGGPRRTVSLRELIALLQGITGREIEVLHEAWRPGDQRYYVSDTRRFEAATGWRARVDAQQGVERLCGWLTESREREPAAVGGAR